jgi:formamidopyrimidine-DNA glycosylase
VPELPEVETVARLVRPDLVGRTITGVDVGWERSLGGPSTAEFRDRVTGLEIEGVGRRGKHVVIQTVRDGAPAGALVVHLRMTGRLHVESPGTPPGPYDRVTLRLDDGRELRFVDVRKFGRFVLTSDPDAFLAHLGPEPLGDDFTPAWFTRALRSRRRILKPLLLDQEFIAGLGNIYVDEALHRAGLHPLRRSDRVPPAKVRELHAAIRDVLEEAIRREGSSFDAFYRTPEGNPGSYQHQFQVYGRDGKPCRRCGRTIRRLVIGQRGTHVCTRCQPAPRASRSAVPRPRRARLRDARGVAEIHVEAWRFAYTGLVPKAHLDALSVRHRVELWDRLIREPPEPDHATFVLARGEEILGFADAGRSRGSDPADEHAGEVMAIYLRPSLVGAGHGRRLFRHALRHLATRGYREAVVWLLEGNARARRFYEAAGFRADGGRTVWRGSGIELPEIRMRCALA